MDPLESSVQLWKFSNPEDAYQAGLTSAAGRFFVRSAEHMEEVRRRCSEIEASLEQIPDQGLRATAYSLAQTIRLQIDHSMPQRAISSLASGLYAIIIKGETDQPFVCEYLDQAADGLAVDAAQWEGATLRLEIKRHLYKSLQFLREMLAAMEEISKSRTEMLQALEQIKPLLAPYENLCLADGIETDDVNELIDLFERNDAVPDAFPQYSRIIKHRYCLPWSPEQIHQMALGWLDEELVYIDKLIDRLAARHKVERGFTSVYKAISERHRIETGVITVATQAIDALDEYTREKWLELSPVDCVEIQATPDYLKELTTEGKVESVDDLTERPRQICFLTPDKNESFLTLLNVLVHEFAHAYQNLLTFRSSPHVILKLNSSIKSPSMEGIGFHREWELYEEAVALSRRPQRNSTEEQLLELFGPNEIDRRQALEDFELETRYWRIARYLRALCDVEVHSGLRTYSGFLSWANERTGFGKRLIHEFCFSFLKNPGYATCYALPGMDLAGLQAKNEIAGYGRKQFNTMASSLGFYPWTSFRQKLMERLARA